MAAAVFMSAAWIERSRTVWRVCFIERITFFSENDLVLDLCLLHGIAHAALGADSDLTYVVERLRQAWPGVRIHFRGDSGLGVPKVYSACEQLDVEYTIGIGMNPRLKKLSDSQPLSPHT